jgi:hypothetical protein
LVPFYDYVNSKFTHFFIHDLLMETLIIPALCYVFLAVFMLPDVIDGILCAFLFSKVDVLSVNVQAVETIKCIKFSYLQKNIHFKYLFHYKKISSGYFPSARPVYFSQNGYFPFLHGEQMNKRKITFCEECTDMGSKNA